MQTLRSRAWLGAGAIACGALVSVGCAALIDSGDDPPLATPDAHVPGADAGDASVDAPVLPGDSSVELDGNVPLGPEDLAAIAKCETELSTTWKVKRPSFGFASTIAAGSYDSVIHGMMDTYGLPGMSVAVTKDGKLVLAKGYGSAETIGEPFVQPDSVFRIASQSTHLTAAAIFKLIEAGKLSLDDKAFTILKHLQPAPNETMNPALGAITIRHLLNHTAGWNTAVEGDPMFDATAIGQKVGVPGPATCPTTIRYMLSRPLTHTPGEAFSYSNFGYCVLGAVIETVSGTTYESYVKENLVTPIGATTMTPGRSLLADRAPDEVTYADYPGAASVPSVFDPTQQVPFPYGGFHMEGLTADNGWVSSTVDVMRFQTRLDGRSTLGPRLLSVESVAAMITDPHVLVGTASGGTQPANGSNWFGASWSVNTNAHWWLESSLPGVSTLQVRAANGFGWTAVFNTRGKDMWKALDKLDGEMWRAFGGTTKWLDEDLFEQFGPLTAWMPIADLRTRMDAAAQASQYASRIDGRLKDGVKEYRARFSPLSGHPVAALYGADCVNYRKAALGYTTSGYDPVSLQSFIDGQGVRRYQASWVKH
jgi:N-acyl-D-amino-acid deacylase